MTLRIAGAQLNNTLGDLPGTLQKMLQAATYAQQQHADLLVFPELVISGYPADDLWLRHDFIEACHKTLVTYAAATPHLYSVVGTPWLDNGILKNAAVITAHGKVQVVYYKQKLPNYGVFDEARYFTPGDAPCVLSLNHTQIGISICEDLWTPEVAQQLKSAGAMLLISLNASPFEITKHAQRTHTLQQRVAETGLPIFYLNAVGGQEDLVLEGDSMLLDASGCVALRMPRFVKGYGVFDFDPLSATSITTATPLATVLTPMAAMHQTLMLGLRDYVRKANFQRVIVGSSGGIDSAVTLALAVEALGAENVTSVMLPSPYTAAISLRDAEKLAKNLHIRHEVIPITDCFHTLLTTLQPLFHGLKADKTEENLQARCRGTLLMALSNKWNSLVITTGNRSELAVGYATLYGDMAGGFAALKDVYKTEVYQLADYINRAQEIIPSSILTRAPTAELKDQQRDDDTLPPYAVLDEILTQYLDEGRSLEDVLVPGADSATVREIIRLVHFNEYKRQQAPIGCHLRPQAFSRRARRYPMTQRF